MYRRLQLFVVQVKDDHGVGMGLGGPWALLIGADGSGSPVRNWIVDHQALAFSQSPANSEFFVIEVSKQVADKNELSLSHQHFWGQSRSLILVLVPNVDGSFCGIFSMSVSGPHSYQRIKDLGTDGINQLLEQDIPGTRQLLNDACDGDFFKYLSEAQVYKWTRDGLVERFHSDKGRVVLLGDAAHCMSSELSQGCNCAMEDCSVMDDIISEGIPVEKLAAEFSRRRYREVSSIFEFARKAVPTSKSGLVWLLVQSLMIEMLFKLVPGWPKPWRHMLFGREPYTVIVERKMFENKVCSILATGTLAGPSALLLGSGYLPAAGVIVLIWTLGFVGALW
eukprot:CAMPEP_0184308712 /NCGR_PEP_ID=MMETSP1049-20130417/17089_1 /TAXON_ID=77928 /ORGANISM="Proteomonas sulcata, Strain CCMP704" /LENGTH=336 /DNA_ID=CAMNT_0026621447 /DNA_START=239 /DNA_END=1246 /DNA_ORIENTATION=+